MVNKTEWKKYSEPIVSTLGRTFTIAIVVGAILAIRKHDLAGFLPVFLSALWFGLGGHFIEIFFLNVVRPTISVNRVVQRIIRILVWFVGGSVLYVGAALTLLFFPMAHPALIHLWAGGLVFIGIELIVHAVLSIRNTPNFYNGLG